MKRILCDERLRSSGLSLVRRVSLCLLGLVVAGCPARKEPPEVPAARRSEGKVIIKGSNTIGEELAPRLIAEYKQQQPKVAVELESKGTASGLTALMAG